MTKKPSPRPVVIFDGDCGICTTLAGVIETRLKPPAAVQPWQRLELGEYGLSALECTEALQYVDSDGTVYAGELAVAQLLKKSKVWARPAGYVIAAPGVQIVAGYVYRWVARNRSRLPGGTPACAVPPRPAPPA